MSVNVNLVTEMSGLPDELDIIPGWPEQQQQQQAAEKRKGTLFSTRLPYVRFDPRNHSRLVKKADGLQDAELRDFLVTHLLGQGAFGKVFLGELAGANQQYAIKVIRKDRLADKPESIKSVYLECGLLI